MLYLSRFRFNLVAEESLILPSYKGSTLRGGFGNAFRRVVCTLRNKSCHECILKEKCVYSYVFETPPPSNTAVMRKYESAPHPFVIEPPPERRRGYKPGDEINFGLILIGRAIDYLPYFIYTFTELGKTGIGKGKGRFELKEVRSQESAVIYSSDTMTLKPFTSSIMSFPRKWESSSNLNSEGEARPRPYNLTLDFKTPTRIIYNGHLTLDLEFHILVRNLLRRLSLLSYFHCNIDPSGWDFKGLIEKAKEIRVKNKDLRWYDWERYSGRQDVRMKMGGFVGNITFEGNIEPFISFIKAGEILHVGKGTAFGLGKYEIMRKMNG
ncbi:MAG: CRISPR system precrRNA processing endoribonuclease RAMP protein Cas6 [Nitrospirota bacterium]